MVIVLTVLGKYFKTILLYPCTVAVNKKFPYRFCSTTVVQKNGRNTDGSRTVHECSCACFQKRNNYCKFRYDARVKTKAVVISIEKDF